MKIDEIEIDAKITSEAILRCAKCNKEFQHKIPLLIEGNKQSDILQKIFDFSIFKAKCTHCGCESAAVFNFVFYDTVENILYYIISPEKVLHFNEVRIFLDQIVFHYKNAQPISEKLKLQNSKYFYVPMKSFREALFIQYNDLTLGTLQFTPQPFVPINELYEISGDTVDFDINLNDVFLLQNNLPNDFIEFVDTTFDIARNSGFPLKVKKFRLQDEPVTSHGIPDIVFYLANSVLLPVLLSIMGNIIYDFFKTKRQI